MLINQYKGVRVKFNADFSRNMFCRHQDMNPRPSDLEIFCIWVKPSWMSRALCFFIFPLIGSLWPLVAKALGLTVVEHMSGEVMGSNIARWRAFFFSSLSYQLYILDQVPHGGATLLNFPWNMLSHAAWGEACLIRIEQKIKYWSKGGRVTICRVKIVGQQSWS